jgi:hypothetical protein
VGAVYKPRGDVHQTIISRYPALTDYVYDFTAYIKTVTRWFVGREFLFDALESFIRQSSRGYFRLIADAGLGKTALAAEIAKRYTAPAYFFSASEGRTRHDQCLNHFCAQLIARYELPYDHLPERAGQDASFLKRLLREAAERHRSDKPLLLVIDALDEADPVHAGQTWLRLPTRLPEGVCVLLTHRPGNYPLTTDARTPVERFSLAWNDPNQQRDIVVHLQRQAERPEIGRALESADPPVPVNEFVAVLKSASEGNFMYLAYVLADIECAEPGYHRLSLDELPQGLRGYYEQFWARMKQPVDKEGWSVWDDLRRPVIALLGAAQEPVTVEWLAVHSGCEAVEVRERVLHRWQRFLRCERHNGPETWHIVHHTFAEFLAQKLDLITVHAQISDRYLSAWGGLNEVLACLHDEEWRNLDGGYGPRHLVVHLAAAGRTAEVHQLLRLEWHEDTRILNTWHAVKTTSGHIGSYLSDIETAWELAVQDSIIGLQCRYALMLASLNSHAGNLPSELLVILVQRGIWTSGQALAHARQMPDLHSRADALAKLARHLPQQERLAVVKEALAAARDIGSVSDRVNALGKLAAHVSSTNQEGVLREALTLAQEIPYAAEQAGALVGLARYLPEALLREVLTAGQAIEDESSQATVIAGVVPYLAALGYAEEASAVAQGIRSLDVRVCALTKLIPHLAPDKQEEVVQEALTTARGIAADEERAKALADLIPFLSGAAREQVVKDAFVAARAF